MLSRLHRHSEALKLILHTEADLPNAYRYCDEVKEREKTMMMMKKTTIEKDKKDDCQTEDQEDEVYLILLEV